MPTSSGPSALGVTVITWRREFVGVISARATQAELFDAVAHNVAWDAPSNLAVRATFQPVRCKAFT